MTDNRETRRLKAQVDQLRAKLHAAHALLHEERLNELHELLHCDAAEAVDQALPGQNITIGHASQLHQFIAEFNRLAQRFHMNACTVVAIPSATKRGYASMQLGGSVSVMNHVRRQMGLAPTMAVGDHAT